jgi:hypothetical protein
MRVQALQPTSAACHSRMVLQMKGRRVLHGASAQPQATGCPKDSLALEAAQFSGGYAALGSSLPLSSVPQWM